MDDYKRKRELKKIEDKATRNLSFSMRSKGLVKKVYEIYVLCDIDVALIMFSPSGRLTQFSGNKRIEDVLTRYMNLPEKKQKCPSETEKWVRAFDQLMASEDMETQQPKKKNVNSQTKELQEEIVRLQQKLQILEEQLSSGVSESHERLDSKSMEELESMEKSLLKTLEHVSQRNEHLSGNYQSSIDPPSSQEMLTSFENQVAYGSPPPYICQGSVEPSSQMGDQCLDNLTPEAPQLSLSLVLPLFQGRSTKENMENTVNVFSVAENTNRDYVQTFQHGLSLVNVKPKQRDTATARYRILLGLKSSY